MQPVKASLLPSEGDFSRAVRKRRYKSCYSKGDQKKPNWLWPAQSYTVSRAPPHVEISKFSTPGFPKTWDKPLLLQTTQWELSRQKKRAQCPGETLLLGGFPPFLSLLSQRGTTPTQNTKRQEWCWTSLVLLSNLTSFPKPKWCCGLARRSRFKKMLKGRWLFATTQKKTRYIWRRCIQGKRQREPSSARFPFVTAVNHLHGHLAPLKPLLIGYQGDNQELEMSWNASLSPPFYLVMGVLVKWWLRVTAQPSPFSLHNMLHPSHCWPDLGWTITAASSFLHSSLLILLLITSGPHLQTLEKGLQQWQQHRTSGGTSPGKAEEDGSATVA